MSYSAKADLIKYIPEQFLIELTNDVGGAAAVDAIIERAIEDADAEIDLYCGKKYTVPFTDALVTSNPIIRKLSVDIAIYNLYARRDRPPLGRVTRYTDAITKLTAIKAGEIQLDITEAGPDSAAIGVMPEFTRGKVDFDGNLLGNVMGQLNDEGGSLDDW